MGQTPTTGLPYPDGTAPVKDGDNAIGALALALDPPWLAPSFGAGWVALSAYPARYRLIGNTWVELSGSAYYSAGIPALSTVLTLPRGVTADDTTPYAVGGMTYASNRSGTWAGANVYLDLRAAGQLVAHCTPVAGVDTLHLDGISFRIKAA